MSVFIGNGELSYMLRTWEYSLYVIASGVMSAYANPVFSFGLCIFSNAKVKLNSKDDESVKFDFVKYNLDSY
jgi:hypothetical protein